MLCFMLHIPKLKNSVENPEMVTGNIQDKLLAIYFMSIPCKFSKSDSSIIIIAQGIFTIRLCVFMLCNNMILMKYSSMNSTVEVSGHPHTWVVTLIPCLLYSQGEMMGELQSWVWMLWKRKQYQVLPESCSAHSPVTICTRLI
jgi:hypothetical protein